jgi:hypothetical protein
MLGGRLGFRSRRLEAFHARHPGVLLDRPMRAMIDVLSEVLDYG